MPTIFQKNWSRESTMRLHKEHKHSQTKWNRARLTIPQFFLPFAAFCSASIGSWIPRRSHFLRFCTLWWRSWRTVHFRIFFFALLLYNSMETFHKMLNCENTKSFHLSSFVVAHFIHETFSDFAHLEIEDDLNVCEGWKNNINKHQQLAMSSIRDNIT